MRKPRGILQKWWKTHFKNRVNDLILKGITQKCNCLEEILSRRSWTIFFVMLSHMNKLYRSILGNQ
jgi:hypothetical protein